MSETAINLFGTGVGRGDVHSLAADLLKRDPDSHFLTLLELYRNVSVDSDIAKMMVEAFNEAKLHLGPPNKLMSEMMLSSTINHLEKQF